ncbi:MAG: hypothetical protein Q8N84_02915 [bacterium]|nr:hypothetical protein [bacterium]
MKLTRKNYESGQSLVEAMIALGVAVIVIVALVNLSLVALRSSTVAQNQLTAKNLANQGLEIVRSLRDSGWSNLPEPPSTDPYYLNSDKTALVTTPAEEIAKEATAGFFTREIYISNVGGDQKKQITCVVKWTDSSGGQQVAVSTYLTNWRQ